MAILPFLLLCMALALETLIVQINGVGVATPRLVDRGLVAASCSVFLVVLFFGPGAQLRPDAARRFELEGFFAELTQYRNGSPWRHGLEG